MGERNALKTDDFLVLAGADELVASRFDDSVLHHGELETCETEGKRRQSRSRPVDTEVDVPLNFVW